MSRHLTFMMGEFESEYPTDRHYARNHMWTLPHEGGYRFGFTAYAVRLLQDVYFLDWTVDAPANLTERQNIGCIESKKAESELFSPATGTLTRLNQALMSDPSMINVDKYGAGWLFDMKPANADFFTPDQYIEHLREVWEVTQRTIKGQLN